MKTLVNFVTWKMHQHASESRGMVKLGGGHSNKMLDVLRELSKKDNLSEEYCVMTRRPVLYFINKARTSVFVPSVPTEGGILCWRTRDELILPKLHEAAVRIASEVGLTEFKTMCEARGPSAPIYWREMLGESFRYLKRWM